MTKVGFNADGVGGYNVTFDVRDFDDIVDGRFTCNIRQDLRLLRPVMVGNITMRFLQSPEPEE